MCVKFERPSAREPSNTKGVIMAARRTSYLIGLLSISAAALLIANLKLAPNANADQVITGDDYQLVTGRTTTGDEALYVLNKTKNLVAIFTWDESRRMVAVRDVRSLDTIMAGAAQPAPSR